MSKKDEGKESERNVKPKPGPTAKSTSKTKQNEAKHSTDNDNSCSWVDNFCCKTEPETVLQKMYGHFSGHHEAALSILKELKNDGDIQFDKYQNCTDIYTLFQMLTFMYNENLQFRAIVDEFNSQYAQTSKEKEDNGEGSSPKRCTRPIEPVTKCVQPKNVPPYGNRSPTCDSAQCLDRQPLDDPLMEYCENPECTIQKKKRPCRGFLNDSDDSLVEPKEVPKPFHDYFDCFLDDKCKESSCYPCNLRTNTTRIKRYIEKYIEAIKAGDEDAKYQSTESEDFKCKCTGFRSYIVKVKQKIKEEELIEKQIERDKRKEIECIACPCEHCPEPAQEDPFYCGDACIPCEPEQENVDQNLCTADCVKDAIKDNVEDNTKETEVKKVEDSAEDAKDEAEPKEAES